MCFATEELIVDINIVSDINIPSNGSGGTFVAGTGSLGYFEIEPGYKYIVKNNSTSRKRLAFSNDMPAVGVDFFEFSNLEVGNTFEFNSNVYNYMFFDFYGYASTVSISRVPLEGYEGAVDNIISYLNIETLLFSFSNLAPYIGIFIVVFVGVYYLRKYLSNSSVGRL